MLEEEEEAIGGGTPVVKEKKKKRIKLDMHEDQTFVDGNEVKTKKWKGEGEEGCLPSMAICGLDVCPRLFFFRPK